MNNATWSKLKRGLIAMALILAAFVIGAWVLLYTDIGKKVKAKISDTVFKGPWEYKDNNGSAYPVSIDSSQQDIYNAFHDSGYMLAVEDAGDKDKFGVISADPRAWLKSHSYLATALPAYFK